VAASGYHFERLADVDWSRFLTLTVDDDCRPERGWRRSVDWIGKFCHWLRRENREGRARTRHGAALEYTWSIEEQPGTQQVHFHMLMNIVWIDYTRLREAWQRIVGRPFAWVNASWVRDRRHAAYYVSRYVSKARLTDDVLAILYRRRQWHSTVPAPAAEVSGWRFDGVRDGDRSQEDTECPPAHSAGQGWTCDWSRAHCYALFSRALSFEREQEEAISELSWSLLESRWIGQSATG